MHLNQEYNDDDFIVCSYFCQANDGLILILGQYEKNIPGVTNWRFLQEYDVQKIDDKIL